MAVIEEELRQARLDFAESSLKDNEQMQKFLTMMELMTDAMNKMVDQRKI